MARLARHQLLEVSQRRDQVAAFLEAERRVLLMQEKFKQDTRHYVRRKQVGRHWFWGIYVQRHRTPGPSAGFR